MTTINWKTVDPARAAQITGLSVAQQGVKRQRGQLSPVSAYSKGKAALTAPVLAEMLLVRTVSRFNIMNNIVDEVSTDERENARRFVAFYGALKNGASQEDALRLIGWKRHKGAFEDGRPCPYWLVGPAEPAGAYSRMSTDASLGQALIDRPAALIINLRELGQQLAHRCGELFEIVDE